MSEGVWRSGTALLDGVDAGETITLEAHDGEYRDYHVWIERAVAVAR